MKFVLRGAFAVLTAIACGAQAETEKLTIYTYSSFVSDWGPGPAVKQAFERGCTCELDFVGLEDGAALLSRLQLEGHRSKADIVLGLDTKLMTEAAATGLLAPHHLGIDQLDLSIDWTDDIFLPYDYGHFAFV